MSNVVFVTEIKALINKESTSTHIMSYNLLKGLSQNGYNITLLAIYSGDKSQEEEIKQYYSIIADKIICIPSRFGVNRNKYNYLLKMLYFTFLSSKHKNDIPINLNLNDCILISHNPSIESIFICKYLRKKVKKYIQYWSDPIAISGIYPKDLSIKRFVHKIIEHKCLSYADKIIYGTKTLCDAQKGLYKKFADRMDYINVSYIEKEVNKKINKNNNFLYAGNYYSSIRNILPLYNVFNNFDVGKFAIYGMGDVLLKSSNNVEVHERISPEELLNIEKDYDNIICLTNTKCLQIPGKIFYNMNEDINILVILDGEYKEEIKRYLDLYKRFYTCYNNEESIKDAIEKLHNGIYNNKYALENFSPKKIAKSLLEKL